MNYEIIGTNTSLPIKVWTDYVEHGALGQAKNLAKLPFAHGHIALMPDVHQGYGMPIGGVMATDVLCIVPNAVGVDIGCGVRCAKLDVNDIQRETLVNIVKDVRFRIPVGFNERSRPISTGGRVNTLPDCIRKIGRVNISKVYKQIGTLGGGNHFIEIQKGDDGYIYVMLHSGSRNLGHTVATYYHTVAVSNLKVGEGIPEDLAYLDLTTDDGRDYFNAMNYCLDYAELNREIMMDVILNIIKQHIGSFDVVNNIDVHHNYAQFEDDHMVHRKGATSAQKGEIGLIPGSQGTASYIVEGLGNPDSFCSCSHGAGRVMSRSKAKANLDLQEQIDHLDKLGVIHGISGISDLDEAPAAYKNIDTVIDNQSDLVKPITRLTPLAVVKG